MFSENFNREAYIAKFQSKLRVLRASADVSQEEVANALGMVRGTYVNYENGVKKIPWEKYLALLFYFQSNPNSMEMLELFDLLPEKKRGVQA